MKYDFESIVDRKGKDATAIDAVGKDPNSKFVPTSPKEGFDFIPMWVADMNFATSPKIVEFLRDRLDHPFFGYFSAKDEYYEAICKWREKRNGFEDLKPEYIGFENGVHGGITTAMRSLTQPGDKVLLHRPTYNGFAMDVEELGRRPIYSDLIKDENGIYRMNYEEMDRLIKENDIHMVIFCSPHNPTGRVWEKEELEKAAKIFEENDCLVIEDQIWADLSFKGHKVIPLINLNDWTKDHVVSMYAASKTFNLASISGSYHIIYNEKLRNYLTKMGSSTHYNHMNIMSMYSTMGAYTEESEEWMDELLEVLEDNCRYATDFINDKIDGVEVTMPEGTYLIFLDCEKYLKDHGISQDELIHRGWDYGVGWGHGIIYNGPYHIRMNLALPKSKVKEALKRMEKYIFI